MVQFIQPIKNHVRELRPAWMERMLVIRQTNTGHIQKWQVNEILKHVIKVNSAISSELCLFEIAKRRRN